MAAMECSEVTTAAVLLLSLCFVTLPNKKLEGTEKMVFFAAVFLITSDKGLYTNLATSVTGTSTSPSILLPAI